MLEKIFVIFIIIAEQLGIIVPFSLNTEKNLSNYAAVESFPLNETYLEEIRSLPELISDKSIDLKSKAFASIDKETAKILISKNGEIKIPIASLTKLMTAAVVLENSNMEDWVVISKNAVSTYGKEAELRPGERLTVESLLHALLLSSSNDAAVALAEHISGDEREFAKLMNKKARDLSLFSTNFKNSSGLDAPDHYSSIKDLALLSRYALTKEALKTIISTKEKTIVSKEGISHYLRNTNKILGNDVLGGKTGLTGEAGECLIAYAQRDGNEIITIVLNSVDRFKETRELINWSFESYKW